MAKDPLIASHLEWLGYLQPVGLVVSPVALISAQAFLNRNIIPEHQRFLDEVDEIALDGRTGVPAILKLPSFCQNVFGWRETDLVEDNRLENLEVVLPEYGETLRPDWAVPVYNPTPEESPWLLLIQQLPAGSPLDDEVTDTDEHHWQATPQARFERLLRETRVPIGLLFNQTHLRLVYAPRGETSGFVTFPVEAMASVAGRPIFAALHMLLSEERLFSLPDKQRLPALLSESRKYQNQVSTQLAGQVLAALYELLRGFQAADAASKGDLLHEVLAEDPNHVYAGLLTVLLRLVFTLYAEDRGLMPNDPVYTNHYSVSGLFERLREDAGRYPDTMDQRYGAWAQLLSLFRLIHDGGSHGPFRLPARRGYLFNPDRYNFLEGRPWKVGRVVGGRIEPPRISDGTIYKVLENLLILDGERLSYRSLDVEQIGSVYETIMGFLLEVANGPSIALKPKKRHGAPVAINLEALLAVKPGDRAKWLLEKADQKITGKTLEDLQAARTPEDVVAALDKKIAKEATPNIVPAGSMVLQPSDERRRSGSHYTPRSLTEPIVRKALEPILKNLSPPPTPEQILSLKVCDPAVGSGAFVVEACRQLGDELVKAWHAHNQVPAIPPDEDEVLHARRLVAQRCLYGVDKNPLAADLAKLSLWLATLAKDHAFTFLDHAFRAGDSLVGLSKKQIKLFNWDLAATPRYVADYLEQRVSQAESLRQQIEQAEESASEEKLRGLLKEADEALADVRMVGDLVIFAFFDGKKPKERESKLGFLSSKVQNWINKGAGRQDLCDLIREMRESSMPVTPFHWEIEFPEVFNRENPGFDVMVGNPPFAGRTTLFQSSAEGYIDWLQTIHEESHGNADLVAHFYRRAFNLIRSSGTFGLIATNTIGQGDTRATGLRWICTHGGTIFAARKRIKWPGEAAVVVSVIHIHNGQVSGPYELDGEEVSAITAFLFHDGGHENPSELIANRGKSFQGCVVVGMGFTFDDSDTKGIASPLSLMDNLVLENPKNKERILPYIGGEEVNTHPEQRHHRYVINFGEMSENDARRGWPDLMDIVEAKVKPERIAATSTWSADKAKRAERWWQFSRSAKDLYDAIVGMERVLVISQTSRTVAFAFLPTGMVYSNKLVVFPFGVFASFTSLQSRPHEVWARFFGSTMKDDAVYTPSDCFETFPFPKGFETDPKLEAVGKEYYEFRAGLMLKNDEGLTKTYNRFHDPEERDPEILRLRELHAAMDRAVLDAYGWTDIDTRCEFLIDYEEDEDEEETGKARKKKKPWRYRWPDETRDEVLARLLALNKERAEEERLSGKAAEGKGKGTRGAKGSSGGQKGLFD